jgi:hypothetical protein
MVLRLGVLLLGLAAAASVAVFLATRSRDLVSAVTEWSWTRGDGIESRGKVPRHSWFRRTADYFIHVDTMPRPALGIDLGAEYSVEGVSILNRLDCCQERARTLEVLTSVDNRKFEWAASHSPSEVFRQWRVNFAPRRARYVRLLLKEETCLHLAEVRIFGR